MIRGAAIVLATALAACGLPAPSGADGDGFTPRELEAVLSLSPLPDPPADPTNAVADNPAAATLGRFLFFDRGLSAGNRTSCATCHDPLQSWTDGRAIPATFSSALRHVPSLWNVAYQRWFSWDGRADSLASQALQPIEDPREMGSSRSEVARHVRGNAELAAAYQAVFGPLPAESVETTDRIFSNVGKAIAAFERKLVSRHSPLDAYVAALRSGDERGRAAYSSAARRGLKLFVGRANCVLCHHGPTLSDGEFHHTGTPGDLPPGLQDPGRFAGVTRLLGDPFNALGVFSDAPDRERALPTAYLVNRTGLREAFKTPGLRNVARTAPYMHRGQFETLEQVVRFYSTLEDPRPGLKAPAGGVPAHTHGGGGGEHILLPLNLSASEISDLVCFLESLTDEAIDPDLMRPPASPVLPGR